MKEVAIPLPQVRDEAVLHRGHVCLIAREFLPQGAFLPYRPPCHHDDQNERKEKAIPGPQEESSAEGIEDEGGIHGMAHMAVRAGGYHHLAPVSLDADSGGQVRVLPECQEEEGEGGEQENRPCSLEPERHL